MIKLNKEWNPYLAGALSGLISIFSVWLTGHFLGASTTFVRIAGAIEGVFLPDRVKQMEYFLIIPPKIDWQVMFLMGIFIGSLIAALLSRDFTIKWVPEMWENRFGRNPFKRALVAFFGGLIAMLGARMAGGCTSGHGLSSSAQLAVVGYVAIVCFFIGGIISARMLYGGKK